VLTWRTIRSKMSGSSSTTSMCGARLGMAPIVGGDAALVCP
jgi:hypothetical protein